MYLYLVDDESGEKPERILHLQHRQQYLPTPANSSQVSQKSFAKVSDMFEADRAMFPMLSVQIQGD
jgi:hypothetical protein